MVRPLRSDFPGAWHHVINRGAARRPIFCSDEDRQLFLSLLDTSLTAAAVELHGYCLMGNHFHLLVRSMEGKLAKAMRLMSGKFTQSLNYRDQTDGPRFRGRYSAVRVTSDAHLLQASRYIHLNPVEARLVGSAADWQWSSASAYLGGQPSTNLQTCEILAMIGDAGRVGYRRFLDAGIDEATRDFYFQTWGQTHGSDPIRNGS